MIDFDEVVRDPNSPSRLLPLFDSGDHLHPNDAGYESMAKAIDLKLFKAAKPIDSRPAPARQTAPLLHRSGL